MVQREPFFATPAHALLTSQLDSLQARGEGRLRRRVGGPRVGASKRLEEPYLWVE
jgi:hypothetical protein